MATPVKGRAPTPKPRATTPEPPTPTPKLPDLSGETIAVQAGDEIIYVHKRLISNSSDFFKNATKPQWKTESRPVDLSDERSSIFKKYCQWLYPGLILPEWLGDTNGHDLARMYVLGEKIVDYEFQNAVIDAIVTCIIQRNTAPSLGFVKIIYSGTTEGSVARRLLVDVWARRITSSWKKDGEELLKPAFRPFLKDLFPAILEERLPRDTIKRNWIPRPELYHRKVVALRSSVAEKKDDEVNTERVNQDKINGSILDKSKDYQFTFTLPGNNPDSLR